MSRRRLKALGSVAILLAVVLAACGGGASTSTATAVPPTLEPTDASGSREVSKADYGKDWPFTADSGTLACRWVGGRPLVTFTPDQDIQYGINGAARDEGFPKVTKKVLKKFPNLSTMQPLIDDGLEMCGVAH